MDGKIIIGTDIDSSGVEDGLLDVENVINKIEQKLGKQISKKMTDNIKSEVDNANEILEKFYAKLNEYSEAYNELNNGGIIFESDVERVANLKQDLLQMIPLVEEITDDKIILPGINDVEKKMPKINLGLKNVIKKITQWGLALFGVRTAYNAIRNAIYTVSNDNQQLKTDIDYMKTALAYTLEPLVRRIVDLAKQLVFYIGYLIKAWTGNDIFEKANKNLKKANGQAKELSKTITDFDEIRTVNDTSSGGGSDSGIPDLSNNKTPKWLETLGNNGKIVAGVIFSIGTAIEALKLGKLLKDLGLFSDLPLWRIVGGIALILGGLALTIKGIIDYLNDPTWENFGKIIAGISLTALGLFILFGGIPALIALIIGAIVALGLAVYKNWDKIKKTFQTAKDWIENKFLNPIKEKFNQLPGWAQLLIRNIANTVITMLNGLISGINAMLLPIRGAITVIGKVMGKNWSLSSVSIPRIPYLAKGGIINQPGRGVPIGGGLARGGENAPEGVIPLTDSQQMSLLGEAIGKYININATVPVYVGNRLVAREIKRINAENDFAYNR